MMTLDHAPTPRPVFRHAYTPPPFLLPAVALEFDLDETATRVTSRFTAVRQGAPGQPLRLDGEDLTLLSIRRDGVLLTEADYGRTAEGLEVAVPGDQAAFEIVTQLNPAANTQLMGLYMSGGVFCTQCEAQGFRRITYWLDRPDVLSRYQVVVRAEKARFPVLLVNGNLVDQGVMDDGRHWVRWDDPFPKPCYLFALVAGNLAALHDRFVTGSGREVALAIWVFAPDLDRCGHAMAALKAAMAWDERVYGREYDLDIYNIVAVGDFNFGAMENKGLNIFNSKYVLARPDTATDQDYEAIEGVIAHEYFHNWSGNRVTCRDWFQLSLKEGFTVYRDQEFSADQGSRALKRIEDVRALRAGQFPEDAGPLAHPIRPDSYIEISNFYTATVYNKGAEVIRMLATLLGSAAFRAGSDLYFSRHDGQAATCDDFVQAMAQASGRDLTQFRLWYAQAGTPHLAVTLAYDAPARRATLKVRQSCAATPGQAAKAPLHIPLRVALFGAESGARLTPEQVLELTAAEQDFVFEDVPEPPVPSLLRGFCAPVTLTSDSDRTALALLATVDDDPFARYEAGQRLALEVMLAAVARGGVPTLDPLLGQVMRATLQDATLDPALVAEAVVLPGEAYVGDQQAVVDVDGIHAVRQAFRKALALDLAPLWQAVYQRHHRADSALDGAAKASRRLKNVALQYLVATETPEAIALAVHHYETAATMTDRMAALTALANSQARAAEAVLADFYERFQHDALVIDKWFTVQAFSTRPDTLQRVLELARHPAFHRSNPNRLRALVGAFGGNQARFHDASGAGYVFLADEVLQADGVNSQTAARLVAPLGRWRRFDAGRAALMRAQLERIVATPGLSKDVYEMTSKSLV